MNRLMTTPDGDWIIHPGRERRESMIEEEREVRTIEDEIRMLPGLFETLGRLERETVAVTRRALRALQHLEQRGAEATERFNELEAKIAVWRCRGDRR